MQFEAVLEKCYVTMLLVSVVHKYLSSYLHFHYCCLELSVWLWLGIPTFRF